MLLYRCFGNVKHVHMVSRMFFRGACAAQLKKYSDSVSDCTSAIELDENYLKVKKANCRNALQCVYVI